MIDEKTTHREYSLPHPDNVMEGDVERIKDSIEKIDIDIDDLYTTKATIENTQSGSYLHALSTGLEPAYEISLSPAPTALVIGQVIHMTAHAQNSGSATLNVNGLGEKAIKKTDGSDLKAGDILSGATCFVFYNGVNFHLINPKVDQEQIDIITSNLMMALEEIQENHGGFISMETGWTDSFSNANEQGADEANSSGFQHDVSNTLYKGTDPGFVPNAAYLWTREEHSNIDGSGTFYISRNGGSEWEIMPMVQQGLPFGDVRIMRGTVDLSGQASGQDLRCRYETTQGKDQFLHSWGLQAKS